MNQKKGMYRGYYILMGIIAILPWIIAIPSMPFLPDHVPIHTDFNGNITDYAGKYSLLTTSILGLVLWLFLFGMCRLVRLLEEDEKVKTGEKITLICSIMGLAVLSAVDIWFIYLGFTHGY